MTASRYARQTMLAQVGVAGQERLARSRVVVLGAGGLGAPVLAYLVAAGVGRVDVVDDDRVDLTNLQRQVLFSTDEVGRPKTEAAAARLGALNPQVRVRARPVRITAATVGDLVAGADVVVDGTDNFATRYLVNDACVLAQVPLVWGAILRFDGQVAVWWAGRGPCYRCVFPEPPDPDAVPSCAQAGVLGPVAGTVGALQATETLKLLLGVGEPLVGRLTVLDALAGTTEQIPVARDPGCAVCGDAPTITAPVDLAPVCVPTVPTIGAAELAALLPGGAVVLDVRTDDERAALPFPAGVAVPPEEVEDGRAAAALAGEDRPVVVVCASGVRSARAVAQLARHGLAARSLAGGVLGWAGSGR